MPDTIGDVKYSILEPGSFIPLNPGWTLLTKQNLEPTSPLGSLGVTQLPDGRGVFIRSMNMDRPADEGDADGNRPRGSFQKDAFANHSHPIKRASPGDNGGLLGGNVAAMLAGTFSTESSPTGGNETRPKNIALYLYIKIN